MRFAPQLRARFGHLNFQKWSAHVVRLICWLGNVLRASTACTFSASQLLKALRSWGALYILTWKCASVHNGVQFVPLWRGYFSTLWSHKYLEKHCESWLSYLFAHLHLLSSHFFSSLIFSLLFFSSLTLPTSAFPSVHIVGSLTSRFPSIIHVRPHWRSSILDPTRFWAWFMSDPSEGHQFSTPPTRSNKFCSPITFLTFWIFVRCLFRCTCAALSTRVKQLQRKKAEKPKSRKVKEKKKSRKVKKYSSRLFLTFWLIELLPDALPAKHAQPFFHLGKQRSLKLLCQLKAF